MKNFLLLLMVATACGQMTEHEWERTHEPVSTSFDTTIIEQPLGDTARPTQPPRPGTPLKSDRRSYTSRQPVEDHSTSQPSKDHSTSQPSKDHSTSLPLEDHSTSQPSASTRASRTLGSAPPHYASLFCYECPPEFLRLGNGCYYFSKEMETWTMAHFECRTRNSQLAVMDSAWEDRVIRGHLNRRAMTRLNRWIGGIYDWSQEQWVWGSSGEVMRYTGFLKQSTISRRWQCAYMAPELFYRWNHTKCTNTMHYICEAPFEVMPRNA